MRIYKSVIFGEIADESLRVPALIRKFLTPVNMVNTLAEVNIQLPLK